jgi:hypothetical protein
MLGRIGGARFRSKWFAKKIPLYKILHIRQLFCADRLWQRSGVALRLIALSPLPPTLVEGV